MQINGERPQSELLGPIKCLFLNGHDDVVVDNLPVTGDKEELVRHGSHLIFPNGCR